MTISRRLIDDKGCAWLVETGDRYEREPKIVIPLSTVEFYSALEIGKIVKMLVASAYKLCDEELEEMISQFRWKKAKQTKRQAKTSYVYLLKSGPYYKIGKANNVSSRMEQLSTLPPFDINLICTIRSTDAYGLEATLHKRFAEKRKRGEWFVLDSSDVEYIKGLST